MEFSCTVTMDDGEKVKHEISLPEINTDDLQQMVDYFGAGCVAQAAKGNIHVQFGKIARSMLEEGKNIDEVMATLREYKPGAKVRVSGGRRKTKSISTADLSALREKLKLNVSDEELIKVAQELGMKVTAPADETAEGKAKTE